MYGLTLNIKREWIFSQLLGHAVIVSDILDSIVVYCVSPGYSAPVHTAIMGYTLTPPVIPQ